MRICGQIEFIKHRRVYFCHFLNFYIFFVVFLKTVKMLKLQFLSCKKYSEHWSTVKNCNFSKLQFFKCTSTVISLHIFAVWAVLKEEIFYNRIEQGTVVECINAGSL